MKKLSKILLISLLAVFLAAGSSMALPTLFIGSGTSAGEYVLVPDNSTLDSNNTQDGVVSYNGSVGSWTVNVTTGLTKPVIGSAESPQMDLNSVNVSGGAGTLWICWSDNDFTVDGTMTFNSLIGGTAADAGLDVVTVYTLLANDNTIQTPWNNTWDVMLYGETFDAGAFSDESSMAYDPDSPFGLTLAAGITHTAAGQSTSFDFGVNGSPVPEPATMLLLGSGLIGLAGIGRKKFFKKV